MWKRRLSVLLCVGWSANGKGSRGGALGNSQGQIMEAGQVMRPRWLLPDGEDNDDFGVEEQDNDDSYEHDADEAHPTLHL